MSEFIVLIRLTASAPPRSAASAMWVMSVTFGVSFEITGVFATSLAHDVIISVYSGTWPTAAPMPRSLMPCGQPKFSSSASEPASSARRTMSCQVSRLDSTIREAMTRVFGVALFYFGDLAEIHGDGAVAD